jgi:hypothetical protein
MDERLWRNRTVGPQRGVVKKAYVSWIEEVLLLSQTIAPSTIACSLFYVLELMVE